MSQNGFTDPRKFPGHGIVKGMTETLKQMVLRRAITVQYPKEKRDDIAERFRGALAMVDYLGKENPDNKLVIEAKEMPPCMTACPANVNARGYISLIALRKYREAYNLHLEANPLPAMCGRLCPHPCEDACIRGEQIDNPVSIMALKRFMADKELELAEREGMSSSFAKPNHQRKEKVAIIGAGPAGLTCAYYLAKWGYQVTILEKLNVPGGMLRIGIPDYRLPPDIIEKEVERIESLGVEFKYGVSLGDDVTLDQLFEGGFSSVFIGIGAHHPAQLGITGEDLEGVLPGEKFLEDINIKKPVPSLGKKVAVIGGGNTAIDCARVALRKGAKVTIMYRRTLNEMPASAHEIEDAMEEGVNFEFLTAPTKILGNKDGKVKGVDCIKMQLGKPDDSGRRRPEPIEGSEHTLKIDTIMSAISRQPYLDCVRTSVNWAMDAGLKISRRCSIETDSDTLATSKEGVFAAGDVVTGPDIAVSAIAGGRKAAVSINNYLSNEKIKDVKRTSKVDLKTLFNEGSRNHMAKIDIKERRTSFDEIETGFTEEQAMREAERCLSCMSGKCIACGICADICPVQAITVEGDQDHKTRQVTKYEIDFGKCIFCGICSEACPTKAIHHTIEYELTEYNVEDLQQGIAELTEFEKKAKAGTLNDAKYRF